MADSPDVWYVRLPDGQVLRAASTAAVRHHLESGRIPLDSRVRRSPEAAWALLERTREFADLVRARPRSAAASQRQVFTPTPPNDPWRHTNHNDGLRLQTVGVRGTVDELLAALDHTLVRRRLLGATAVGLVTAVLLVLMQHLHLSEEIWPPLTWLAAGVVLVTVYALYAVLVTQMIFIELSQLRPGTRREIAAGLLRNWLRLVIAGVLVGGLVFLPLGGLLWLEGELRAQAAADGLTSAVTALRLVLEVLAWPVFGLALLLAPVVVIEERSSLRALHDWWVLLREHLSRVFVYEALAAALGTVTSLPLVFPVALAAWSCSAAELLNPAVDGTLVLLCGLALTPGIAYLAVANVYIYLNLRYER